MEKSNDFRCGCCCCYYSNGFLLRHVCDWTYSLLGRRECMCIIFFSFIFIFSLFSIRSLCTRFFHFHYELGNFSTFYVIGSGLLSIVMRLCANAIFLAFKSMYRYPLAHVSIAVTVAAAYFFFFFCFCFLLLLCIALLLPSSVWMLPSRKSHPSISYHISLCKLSAVVCRKSKWTKVCLRNRFRYIVETSLIDSRCVFV